MAIKFRPPAPLKYCLPVSFLVYLLLSHRQHASRDTRTAKVQNRVRANLLRDHSSPKSGDYGVFERLRFSIDESHCRLWRSPGLDQAHLASVFSLVFCLQSPEGGSASRGRRSLILFIDSSRRGPSARGDELSTSTCVLICRV
jgi:hypothetical protein